jgi:hypothetical protein
MFTKEAVMASSTTLRIRRIRGEAEPKMPLSRMSSEERLEALDRCVRDLKPSLRFIATQKLEYFGRSRRCTITEVIVGAGLEKDTHAASVKTLVGYFPLEVPGSRTVLMLTSKGVWIYWDSSTVCANSVSDFATVTSSFSVAPRRELLDLVAGRPGQVIVSEVIRGLWGKVANVLLSHEQRAAETRSNLGLSQRLAEVVDIDR